jgi:hypothetical protein
LSIGLHNDDPSEPGYLELEVGIARDGHELDITWLSQDDVVGSRKIDHLECECLGVVVAHVSEGDQKSEPSEGGGLLA